MDLTSVFDQTITAEKDPIIITGLTSPVVMVHLLPETLKGSYPESPVLAVEQILPNAGSPFIADRQLVEMKAEPILVRLRANYPYFLRIDYPGWINRGTLKVWEVEDFNFFTTGGSSGPPPDLTGYVQTSDPRLSDARAPLPHTQGMDTITGLTSALASKLESSALGSYALANDPRLSDARSPLPHTQGIDTINGLQSALDAKANIGSSSSQKINLALNQLVGTRWFGFIGGNSNAATDGNSSTATDWSYTTYNGNEGQYTIVLPQVVKGTCFVKAGIQAWVSSTVATNFIVHFSTDDLFPYFQPTNTYMEFNNVERIVNFAFSFHGNWLYVGCRDIGRGGVRMRLYEVEVYEN